MMDSAQGDVTCMRLVLDDKKVIYVRVVWFPNRFVLDVSDGLQAWTISPSSETIADRASQWDQSVTEYMKDLRLYLSEQQPVSVYKLVPTEDSGARLSWTLERATTKLESRWRLKKAANPQELNCQILDFVLDTDAKIREDLKQKNKIFESMKAEVEKCLTQNKRLAEEKNQHEEELFRKFVAVLNSKKAKLREVRIMVPEKAASPSDKTTEDEDLGEDTDKEDDDDNNDSGDKWESPGKRKASQLDIGLSHSTDLKGKQKVSESTQNLSEIRDSPERNVWRSDSKPPLITESSQVENQPSDIASALLSGSSYKSVPRKRRLL